MIPMIEGARGHFEADPFKEAAVLADAGYCSEANARYLSEEHIDGYLADPMFRKRDPRFIDAARYKPTRPDEPFAKPKREIRFQPKDFQIAADRTHAICPAGKRLYRNGRHRDLQGYEAICFRGTVMSLATSRRAETWVVWGRPRSRFVSGAMSPTRNLT